ncbi:MAG: DUF3149 domain-containing protein [Methylotenera sp.]
MLSELFTTYAGSLALAIIVFTLGTFVFIYRFFLQNEADELNK